MLGAEHAVRRPEGLTALVIANSPANMRTWVSEANRLRRALPGDVQAALLKHEEAGSTTNPEHIAASGSRQAIGSTVLGGLLLGTVLGLVVIPVLYIVVQTAREAIKQRLIGAKPSTLPDTAGE